jgi:TPR repeat protein
MKLNLFRRCLIPVFVAVFCLCGPQAHGQEVSADEFAKWRKAAEQGDALTQARLGLCYAEGTGVVKDEKEAVKWFRKAAEQGDALAQSALGVCYSEGTGVVKDETEAVKWYRKAAEQGHASAQFNLGVCYSEGMGVVKDDVESYKWELLAAANGSEKAKKNMAISERSLTPEQRAEGQRLAKEWQAKIEESHPAK